MQHDLRILGDKYDTFHIHPILDVKTIMPHAHHFFEIAYFGKGTGVLRCNDTQFELRSPALHFCSPFPMWHTIDPVDDRITTSSMAIYPQLFGHPTEVAGDLGCASADVSPMQLLRQFAQRTTPIIPLKQLFPELMDVGQRSTYTCLYPYDLELIGNETRADVRKLGCGNVMPWLSPGDAGTFPGEAFQWALLECFSNGAGGIYFWSSRVWDGETLIAFNRVVRAIAPVETLVVEGELVGDTVRVIGPGRVSGMKRGGEMFLLVADYHGKTNGTVTLQMNITTPVTLRDLLNETTVANSVPAGDTKLEVPLDGQPARLLHLVPTP